jgi:hypothetical protein
VAIGREARDSPPPLMPAAFPPANPHRESSRPYLSSASGNRPVTYGTRGRRLAGSLLVAFIVMTALAATLFLLTIGSDAIVPRTVYGGPGPATQNYPNVSVAPSTCVTPWGIKVTCPPEPWTCGSANCTGVACVANPGNYTAAVAFLGLTIVSSAAAIGAAVLRRIARRRVPPR